MAKKSLSDLPEGMITEILLRLAVKSLLQCKSVCKPWLSTISSPHFVKSHLHHAFTASRNDPTLLNIIDVQQLAWIAGEGLAGKGLAYSIDPSPDDLLQQQRQRRRRQLVNQALDDANAQNLSKTGLQFDRVPIPRPFTLASFVSCCNGIICLSNYNVVYLWNPSINKFKKLPLEAVDMRETHRRIPVTIGFGYDDIKLLRFVYKRRNNVVPVVKVCYIDADCCREIQAPILKTQIDHCPSNIVVNRVLYFDGGDQLVSFDLHKELFELVPFPNSFKERGQMLWIWTQRYGYLVIWVQNSSMERSY